MTINRKTLRLSSCADITTPCGVPMFVALAVVATALGACGKSETPPSSAGSAFEAQGLRQLAHEVYVYAYPLVLMDVSRQVLAARTGSNQFRHSVAFPDANFTGAISPNADTLCSTAWLDLKPEPLILSVPDTKGRYYVMQMLDAWTNVFAAPGKRITGTGRGDFAIVGPEWRGQLPAGTMEVRSPTNLVWLLGRTQTNGLADFAAVHALQQHYKLTPLSAWTGSDAPAAMAPPAVTRGDQATPPVVQVRDMDAATFFSRFAALLPDNPPTPEDAPMVEKLARLGITPGKPFLLDKPDAASARAIQGGAKDGFASIAALARNTPAGANGWSIHRNLGRYGTEYLARAFAAWMDLGANLPEDAVYPTLRADAEGQALTGANRYVLHFDKGQLPPVNAFWSLTLYNDRQFFAANPLNRYAIGDRDKLGFNKDGSLDLYVQNASPGKDKEANWLPAPAEGFNLVLRLYWPKAQVLDGSWVPPPLQKRAQ